MNKELNTFIKNLEESILKVNPKTEEGVGIITAYSDGVIEVQGLPKLKMGEVVTIKGTKCNAVVLSLQKEVAKALVINNALNIKEGMLVKSTGSLLSVGVSDKVLGKVVNSLGEVIDGSGQIQYKKQKPLEKVAPGVFKRESVDEPLLTGITAIDSLIPIGKGQRELIIGDRQTGKTTLAIDTIINQKGKNVVCIYTSIAQRESNVSKTVSTLKKFGAMDYTCVVSAGASSSAMMQFLAPYTATAIAESFLDEGKDVLIIYDDLSKHAVSYREISLLLKRPPGREAYPGDVFYIHSRLLERSVKLNKKNGGGSITSLPIIETQAGDVSAYVPTNVISITDGQIFLESSLFNKGIIPAINVGLSVSRVGSAAQYKIMKKVAGTLKLDLANYYELEAFSQFSSELDEKTKKVLQKGQKIVNSLVQDQNKPLQLWEQIVLLYGVTKDYFEDVKIKNLKKHIEGVLTTFEAKNKNTIKQINKELSLSAQIEEDLKNFFTQFNKK